jgi:hypothetical protein
VIGLLLVVYSFSWLPWWFVPVLVWLAVAVLAGLAVARVVRIADARTAHSYSFDLEEARDG